MIAGVYFHPSKGDKDPNKLSIYLIDKDGNYVDGFNGQQMHRLRIRKILKDFIRDYRCRIITNNDELTIINEVRQLGFQRYLIQEPKFTVANRTYGIYTCTRSIMNLLRKLSGSESEDLNAREKAKGMALLAWKMTQPDWNNWYELNSQEYLVGYDPHQKPGDDTLGEVTVYKKVASYRGIPEEKTPTIPEGIDNLLDIIKSNPEFIGGGRFIDKKYIYSYSLQDNTFKLTINL